MHHSGRRWAGVALVAACAGRSPVPEARLLAAEVSDIRAVATAALLLDGRADPGADSLFTPDAVLVANGRPRARFPRFAAVGPGGQIAIMGLQVEVSPGGFAWVYADYQWTAPGRTIAEAGYATLLLRPGPRGWRIFHAHSSQMLPWQP